MSIEIMSRVWDQSSREGSSLLLLLALADHASDDGVCWPGIAHLAHKTRKTERHTKRLLVGLEESGEVYIARETGRGNTNMYYVTLGFTQEEMTHTLIKRFGFDPGEAARIAEQVIQLQKKGDTQDTFSDEGKDRKGDIQGQKKVTPGAEKVTSTSGKGDIAMSPEPSRTAVEPSIKNLTADPLSFDLERQTEITQERESNWSTPPDAGGTDPFADGPTDAFAEILAGIPPLFLPPKDRQQWARKLRQIAERWSTEERTITAGDMERAIRAIPDSGIGWKTYTSPFTGNFETDIGTLLLGSGPATQKGASHGPRQWLPARDDPNYRVAPPPEESEQTAAVVAAVKAREARLRDESGQVPPLQRRRRHRP